MNLSIEKIIIQLKNYFKNKVISGDYKLLDFNNTLAEILIDNKYPFTLWISYKPELFFDFFYDHYIREELDFYPKFKTKKERIKAYKNFLKHKNSYKNGN